MSLLGQLSSLPGNLANLGNKRLAALGGIAALAFGVIIAAAVFLNRPAYETLYVGLEANDSNQIAIALAEMNISFDVSSDGGTVSVPAGMTSRARIDPCRTRIAE